MIPEGEAAGDAPGKCGGLLVLLAGLVSGSLSFAYYYAQNLTLAHYDAKAHLLIARRIVESSASGYIQLGTHWLPLIHLLYLPLVVFDSQYRTGIGPSLISVAGFSLSGWLVYRITRRASGSHRAGLFAGLLFIANPNLLYLQSCPLMEPLYLPLMLLAVDFFYRWREEGREGLPWAGALWTALGALCRYEAWCLLAVICLICLFDALSDRSARRRALGSASLYLAAFAVPVAAHFGYLYWQVRDSFLLRVAAGNPVPSETYKKPLLALAYHAGELGQVAALVPLLVGVAGLALCLAERRHLAGRLPLFLLWTPSLVNLSALYWGMIYRVRYSALLVPAVVVFAGLVAASERASRRAMASAAALAALLPWLSWAFGWDWKYHMIRPGPGAEFVPLASTLLFIFAAALKRSRWPLLALCLLAVQFPVLEGETRPVLEEAREHSYLESQRSELINLLCRDYDGSRILVDLLKQAPLAYDSGIPPREFIGNDAERSAWRAAMGEPGRHAGWLLASRDDEVWNRVRIDPGWADGYSLVLQSSNYLLYRRAPAAR